MDNVTDFNAAQARERTDKARGSDADFIRSLGKCLAEISAAAEAGNSQVVVAMEPITLLRVRDELVRRGFRVGRSLSAESHWHRAIFW